MRNYSFPTTYAKTAYTPDPNWMAWTSTFLPPSIRGFFVQDLDAIIRDRRGNILLLEIKRRGAKPTQCQAVTLHLLHKAFEEQNGRMIDLHEIGINDEFRLQYHGCHLLQLDGTDFFNSTKRLNGRPVTDKELIAYLSFHRSIPAP